MNMTSILAEREKYGQKILLFPYLVKGYWVNTYKIHHLDMTSNELD